MYSANKNWLNAYLKLVEFFESNEEYKNLHPVILDWQQSNEMHNFLIKENILGENRLIGQSDIIVAMNVAYQFYISDLLIDMKYPMTKAYMLLLFEISSIYLKYEKELSPVFKANYMLDIEILKKAYFNFLKTLINDENKKVLKNSSAKKLVKHNGLKNRRPGKGHRH